MLITLELSQIATLARSQKQQQVNSCFLDRGCLNEANNTGLIVGSKDSKIGQIQLQSNGCGESGCDNNHCSNIWQFPQQDSSASKAEQLMWPGCNIHK